MSLQSHREHGENIYYHFLHTSEVPVFMSFLCVRRVSVANNF